VFFVSLEDDLVIRNAGDVLPPSPTIRRNGLVEDDEVSWAVGHAQRVAEGVNHELHRNTWRYSVVIEQQRKALAERRERVLTTDVAGDLARDRFPEKCEDVDDDVINEIARQVVLHHIDRLWAEHLAELNEVREGVHLRALARVDPLDEFHRAAVPAFNDLVPAIEERTIATLEQIEFTDDWQPDQARLTRPTATWTYLVHDSPFGTEMDRLISFVGRGLRKTRE
jgi:preprotein translocase subunit SecA